MVSSLLRSYNVSRRVVSNTKALLSLFSPFLGIKHEFGVASNQVSYDERDNIYMALKYQSLFLMKTI